MGRRTRRSCLHHEILFRTGHSVFVGAVVVFEFGGGRDADGAVADGILEGVLDVVHFEGDVLDAVAVEHEPHVVRIVGAQRRREDKRNLPLFQHVSGFVLDACFEPSVSDDVETERIAIEICRLLGVADEETHMVDAAQRERDAQVRAQVTGYLLKQNYQNGAFVRQGAPLFQIDPQPFQAQLDAAKGNVAVAVGNLQRAQAQLGKTEQDVARYTPLAKESAISQQELDDAVQADLASFQQFLANNTLPNGQANNREFRFTAFDLRVSKIENLQIQIVGTNHAPVAVNDTASATEAGGTNNGTPGVNPTGNVLTNDTDADAGDTKTVAAVAGLTANVGYWATLSLNIPGPLEKLNVSLPCPETSRSCRGAYVSVLGALSFKQLNPSKSGNTNHAIGVQNLS